MTETEARQKLIGFVRSAPGRLPHVVTEAIKVLERAIDIADKHAILAAEHQTLLECHRADHEAHEALKEEHNRAMARIRDLDEEIDARNAAALERERAS